MKAWARTAGSRFTPRPSDPWGPPHQPGEPEDDDRRPLVDALARAEARARRPLRGVLSRPLRQSRLLAARWAGPVEVDCRLFTGQRMRVVLPEIVGCDLFRHGFIEAPLTRVLLDHLHPGMVFVDVGAQYGYHSLLASLLVRPGGAVIALEPGRAAYRLLQTNVAGAVGIRADDVAAGSRTGEASYQDFGVKNSALNTLLTDARVPAEDRRQLRARPYRVRCTTLDEYLGHAGLVPDFVKIDAEGAELDILQGMRRLLTEGGPMLAVETGDYEGMSSPETGESIEFLDGLGYRCLEYAGGLRPHRRRSRYDYGNLFFVKHG